MLPLSGIRVIAWTIGVAGPYGGMILADLGAEVINMERRGEHRRIGGALFTARNKKSITIDARTDDGKEIIRKLIATTDVFYENYAPSSIERLGFSPEEVFKINPRIVYASGKGYGEGPYGMRPAYDPCIEAEAGWMDLTKEREAEKTPLRCGVPSVDIIAGMFNALTIIGALLKRRNTGKGEYIRVNMFEEAVSIMSHHIALYTLYGRTLGPIGIGEGADRAYETADWWVYVDAHSDESWTKLCKALDVDEETMRTFASQETREENPDAVEDVLAKVISKMTTRDVVKKLREVEVPAGAVNLLREVIDDPHLQATGTLTRLVYPKEMLTGLRMANYDKAGVATMCPVRTSAYNPSVVGWGGRRAPDLGEDTRVILQELGYTPEQITDLRERKIV